MNLKKERKTLNFQFSTFNLSLYFLFFIFSFSFNSFAQQKLDTASVKHMLQGLWAGPDESYYFLFRGDSVKEWETDGADSALKPNCAFTLTRIACDTFSAHVEGATGMFLTILCHSVDYDENRCYFIQSIDEGDLKLGTRGRFDDSGELRKLKTKN